MHVRRRFAVAATTFAITMIATTTIAATMIATTTTAATMIAMRDGVVSGVMAGDISILTNVGTRSGANADVTSSMMTGGGILAMRSGVVRMMSALGVSEFLVAILVDLGLAALLPLLRYKA